MGNIKNEEIQNIFYSISKKFILPKFRNLQDSDLERKSNNDLVTSVDIVVEEQFNIELKKLLPSSYFIGEELFEKDNSILDNYNQSNYCWTVDPIDGTANFVNGKEKFAIMISLSFKEKILQSWIYKPLVEEMCYALNGDGSFIGNFRLKTNNKSNLNESNGSISTKYWNDDYKYLMKDLKNKFDNVFGYGCIGYEYIDIANGKRDFAVISKLSPWDHLPGILIAREAGAIDMYFDQGQYNFQSRKQNLIVTNNKILNDKIFNLIKGENQ